ncbi:MAG TPA: lactate racemase domain-containing protein [Candidatus Acidoferrum sp.]|nr:lactate racemase domain-containing protein [Candidatus Acidoferrum sp.]
MEFWLPYGVTDVAVAIPDENLLGFLAPLEGSTSQGLDEIISAALVRMRDGTLFESASRAKKTVIAFNGRSIVCSSAANMLGEKLVREGIQGVELLEGAPDPTLQRSGLGSADSHPQALCQRTRHDARASQVVKVGQLDDGSEILLNENFVNADIKCVVANVAVNPFWGYSGGPNFMIPELASEKTVKACLSPSLRSERSPGTLAGNPMHETLLRASQTTRVDFAIHLVERPDGKVAGAFAGDFMETFQRACALAAKIFRPPLRRKADIVILSAGGVPWDRSFFEASPSLVMAVNICKDQGIIILVAECSDGSGELPSAGLTGSELKARLAHARKFFSLDMLLEYSFRKVAGEHRVYLVSTLPEHQASLCQLLDAKSVKSALERAIRHMGKDAKIALLPYGSHTAPILE